MKKVVVPILLVFVIALAGCSQHLGNFSALATGNYNAKNINSNTLVKKDAVGGSSRLMILGIPLGQPKVDEAVADALRQNNGDYMQNASLYSKMWTLILIGEMKYEVKGDVYQTQK